MSALKEKRPENINRRGEPELSGMTTRRWEFVYSTVVPNLADNVESDGRMLRPVTKYNLYTLGGMPSRVGCYAVRLDEGDEQGAPRAYSLCGLVYAMHGVAEIAETSAEGQKVCAQCKVRIAQPRVQAALRENLPVGHVIMGPHRRERVERFHDPAYRMDRELSAIPEEAVGRRSMMDGAPGMDESTAALKNDHRSTRDVHRRPSESERAGMSKSQLRRAKRLTAKKRQETKTNRKRHAKDARQNAADNRAQWAGRP